MTKKETFKCADYCVDCNGDTDGAGSDLLHGVLNKEEAFWSLIPERFSCILYS